MLEKVGGLVKVRNGVFGANRVGIDLQKKVPHGHF